MRRAGKRGFARFRSSHAGEIVSSVATDRPVTGGLEERRITADLEERRDGDSDPTDR